MIRYAKVINEKIGLCEIGTGTNTIFYKSIGMVELDVQQSDVDNNWYLTEKCPMKTEEDKIIEREKQFNEQFFKSSLGYIRRKVTMANGDIKDFLTDLLPSIAMGIQLNQSVSIITYREPDFTEDVTDLVKYQEVKQATAEFIQECFVQLNNDFMPPKIDEPVKIDAVTNTED